MGTPAPQQHGRTSRWYRKTFWMAIRQFTYYSFTFSGDTSFLVDRGLSLGHDLLRWWELLRHVAVWWLLRNDRIIWHWSVQVTDATNGPWSSLGHTTEGWRRCCRPRSRWICIFQSSDVIQF